MWHIAQHEEVYYWHNHGCLQAGQNGYERPKISRKSEISSL